jgi:hypothetical protein
MSEGLLKETASQSMGEAQCVVDLLGLLIGYAQRTSQVFSNGTVNPNPNRTVAHC